MERQTLKGRTVVITGAGSGIGRGLASVLSRRGCKVAISDIDEAGLAQTAGSLEGECFSEVVDVSDRAAVFAHAERVRQRLGPVDVVINNAGVDVSHPFGEHSLEDFEWLMNINFWGVVYGTKAYLPDMLARNSGTIVNVSSIFGVVGWPSQSSYCAAKFAVRGFTESLRHELDGTGVKTLLVHPGAVATNIVRNARFYMDENGGRDKNKIVSEFAKIAKTTPEQAAETIVAALEAGQERVLPGDGARLLDWLQRLAPVSYHRILSRLKPGNPSPEQLQSTDDAG
ncbi:SDR family NAD(P)-dependent oxidoreductase [Gilvimarinus sp. F26214L]|uniref:SDR family NAD(P)-dependent oxidoreductase n=1 Tax=Gilvimarinus sp. DZF01 TaxID=3461371 RepID=UPI004045EE51